MKFLGAILKMLLLRAANFKDFIIVNDVSAQNKNLLMSS